MLCSWKTELCTIWITLILYSYPTSSKGKDLGKRSIDGLTRGKEGCIFDELDEMYNIFFVPKRLHGWEMSFSKTIITSVTLLLNTIPKSIAELSALMRVKIRIVNTILVSAILEKYTILAIKVVPVFLQNVPQKLLGCTSLYYGYFGCFSRYWHFS